MIGIQLFDEIQHWLTEVDDCLAYLHLLFALHVAGDSILMALFRDWTQSISSKQNCLIGSSPRGGEEQEGAASFPSPLSNIDYVDSSAVYYDMHPRELCYQWEEQRDSFQRYPTFSAFVVWKKLNDVHKVESKVEKGEEAARVVFFASFFALLFSSSQ